MPPPLVTIITPTYRRKDLDVVARMMRSVQTQTYTNWEHVICSDGEHEPSVEQLATQTLADPRRRYVVSATHHGGYGAPVRQEVMDRHARGALYAFLDDDNIIFPDYLEKMVGALLAASCGEKFAICRIVHCGPEPGNAGIPLFYMEGAPRRYWIDTLQVVVDAEAMRAVGWQGNAYIADGITYEELGRRYKYVRVRECLGVHL